MSVSHSYMYYMHSCIYPEMACIRLGENAGVMDLAVKCTLQVRGGTLLCADDSIIHWNLSVEDPSGPSWLSCIQWNLSIEDTTGTQLAVLYTVEPLYRGHHQDPASCPV